MQENFLFLCQALNAKLCHELAGSIGVNNTCIDLLDTSDDKLKENSLKLLKQNSEYLFKRFKFYRWIYGLSAVRDKAKYSEIEKLINDFISTYNNLSINYSKHQQISIDCGLAKILMCLIAYLVSALYKGGEINIIYFPNIKIVAVGEKIHIEKSKIDILLRAVDLKQVNVQNSNEYYIQWLMNIIGFKLDIKFIENELIEFSLEQSSF